MVGDFIVACQNFLVKESRVWIFEGQIPAEKRKHDDPEAPDVHWKSFVSLSCNHFWGSVARRATGRFEQLPFLVNVREAEIHNFNVFLVVQKEVLRLEVPMDNAELVKVFDSREDLLDEFA